MKNDRLDVDFLVIGGGMAGMTAAAYAAHHGARVAVIEKAPKTGGSAVLSGGALWTVASVDVLDAISPLSNSAQRRVVVENYQRARDWLASTGIMINQIPFEKFHLPAVANMFDVAKYIEVCETYVTAAGGYVVTNSQTDHLIRENGKVVGASIRHDDGDVDVYAPWTLLATGGFQGDSDLRKKYIGGGGENMLLRSNPNSTGDGLRLGASAGAALSPHMNGYYGHTIATPRNRPFTEKDYLPLSQYFLATHSIVVDQNGERFIDESIGYYAISQAVCQLPTPRALVLFDDAVRREDIEFTTVDRPDAAAQAGAHVAKGNSWREIAEQVEAWGYRGIEKTVAAFNTAMADETAGLSPPRRLFRKPLTNPPFFAIESEPAITFTHGGLRIDAEAHVLDKNGNHIPGLLAAGADAGGTYHIGYAGGLAMACTFGLKAADVVLENVKAEA